MTVAMFSQLLSNYGVAALLFLVVWQHMKTTNARFEKLIEQQSDRDNQHFSLLQRQIDTLKEYSDAVKDAAAKMKYNLLCPYVQNGHFVMRRDDGKSDKSTD